MFLKIAGQFFSCYGGVAGVSPAEGGSGKAVGFAAGGKAFPLFNVFELLSFYVVTEPTD
jgi:hypothetical protein